MEQEKIANGLAKLNYNLKFLYLTFNKVALNVDIHRMRCFPTRGSINVLITTIVVAIISLHSVSPGFVSIVYAVQGSDLTSYPNPMMTISPYSVGQSNQLYQTPLLQNNPAQPYGIPSTSATIQPQLSALPPTATTFPPSVLPPVNSLQPYGTLGSTGSLGYPSTTAGQYCLGGASAAAATSVGTSSQLISPWFPSLPASYCGGTFLLTLEGTPRNNGDDKKIEPSDKNNNNHDNNRDDNNHDGNNHKHSNNSDRDNRLLSLQINSYNTRIFTDDEDIWRNHPRKE
jgi:hypothetical protein